MFRLEMTNIFTDSKTLRHLHSRIKFSLSKKLHNFVVSLNLFKNQPLCRIPLKYGKLLSRQCLRINKLLLSSSIKYLSHEISSTYFSDFSFHERFIHSLIIKAWSTDSPDSLFLTETLSDLSLHNFAIPSFIFSQSTSSWLCSSYSTTMFRCASNSISKIFLLLTTEEPVLLFITLVVWDISIYLT